MAQPACIGSRVPSLSSMASALSAERVAAEVSEALAAAGGKVDAVAGAEADPVAVDGPPDVCKHQRTRLCSGTCKSRGALSKAATPV